LKLLSVKHKYEKEPLYVSIVIPVYDEIARFNEYDAENNPQGQHFLYNKNQEVEWLLKGIDQIRVRWLLIDDGCPKQTGKYIQSAIDGDKSGMYGNSAVYHLQDVIDDANDTQFKDMKSAKTDSRKGGAVEYGMYLACNAQRFGDEQQAKLSGRNHIIISADCDLCLHMACIGQSIYGLLSDDKMELSMASRYGIRHSVLAYQDGKMVDSHVESLTINRMLILIRHLVRMLLLPDMGRNIVDTQVPFKAVWADTLQQIILSVKDRGSAWDQQWLLLLFKLLKSKYATNDVKPHLYIFPCFFIEDFASSKFGSQEKPARYYYPMIKAMLQYYQTESDAKADDANEQKDSEQDAEVRKFCKWIEAVNETQFYEMNDSLMQKYPKTTDFFGNVTLTADEIMQHTPGFTK